MTAPLQNLSITLKVVALEKVSLVIDKFLRLFVNTMPADDKNYLLNRDNSGELIQMQISQKQKTFSQFCFPFLKPLLDSKHFPKKGDPHS